MRIEAFLILTGLLAFGVAVFAVAVLLG